jgi:transposase
VALGLTDEEWAVLEPLVEACRPHAKVPPSNLRRTVLAIIWRHQNGAMWRALPEEFGPWWVRALPGRRTLAAQTFIRWSRLGVWERLLSMAQARGVELGMAFLDGTSIRAHQKAAGAAVKTPLRRNGVRVKRLAGPRQCLEPWRLWYQSLRNR